MEYLAYFVTIVHVVSIRAHINEAGPLANKLFKVRPVGAPISKNFVPLTEIPPPGSQKYHMHNGRRHLEADCTDAPKGIEVNEAGRVEIVGDYYEEKEWKTLATVIIPDHIDHKHFEVTSPIPYLTVGEIDGIGYHPSTIQGDHPAECEKIYQDHVADQYSDEDPEYSEESLEVARMLLSPGDEPTISQETYLKNIYDMSI